MAETNWQPIETAPKDGTEILVHVEHNETRVAWWNGKEWDVPGIGPIYPTHWLPIPDYPDSRAVPRG